MIAIDRQTARTIPDAPSGVVPPGAPETRAAQIEEDAAIWTRSWVCVGFAADIPRAGDILPFTVGDHGIHVERLAGGTLAGRFNKAQHGGCRSVPVQCQTGTKTRCSFTACGYSRDRGPIAADAADRDASLDQYLGLRPERLLPVAIRTWGPLVVAQLAPAATTPFTWPDASTLLPDPCLPDPAAAPGATGTRWVFVPANWKRLARSFAPTARDEPAATLLFPNVLVLDGPASAAILVLQPTGLEQTLCRIRLFGADTAGAAPGLLAAIEAGSARAIGGVAAPAPVSGFDAELAAALGALRDTERSGPLYRTNDKGGW